MASSGLNRGLLGFAVGAGAAAVVAAALWLGGIRFNGSASMPLGFYRQDEGGTFAELCPPGEWGPLSAARGYRAHAIIDRCGDGSIPLLKPVVATFGDRVDVSTAGVTVNGVVLPNSAALASDAQGRPLQHVPFGQYLVGPGQVWVISTFSPRSFDSRYFGPVQAASIRRMKALLLF